MFKQKLKFNKQGNIALILVIMVTTLTLVSALTLALINISDLTANYHLLENENVVSQKDACAEEAMNRISQNLYATGTYYLTLDNIYCDYQLSDTVAGLKTVTTTASTGSSLGYWQSSSVIEVNVSSTPISINSYKDLSGDIWDSYGWQYRMKITVNADKVVGELHNFPVYVNLADLGSEFFDNIVNSSGLGIVVTAGDGSTRLFRELVDFDQGAGTGELHFLAPILVGGVNNDFYIYYGRVTGGDANDDFWLTDYSLVQHLNYAPVDVYEFDSSQSNNNARFDLSMGPSDLVDAKVGTGVDLDGADDELTITSPINMSTAQGTISLWVNFSSVASASTLFHFYELASTDYIRSYVSAGGGYIDLVVEDEDATKVNVRYMSPDTSGWHKLDYVQDGSGVKIYFDGQQKSLTEVTQSGDWWSDHLTLAYAEIGGVSWGRVSGVMDEFRVTSKALSPDWLVTEYNNQSSPSTFYSTSTPDSLPAPDAPVCGGVEMNGYCWYMASTYLMSCNAVCAENGGLSCVPSISSFSDPSCLLNLEFAPFDCSAGCQNYYPGADFAPGNYFGGGNLCFVEPSTPIYDCAVSETTGATRIICACE